MLTVIEVLELVARHNEAREGRKRKLDTLVALLIKSLVLEEHVEILDDTLAIEASHLVGDWLAIVLVAIDDVELIGIEVLANGNDIIALLGGIVVDQVDANRGIRVSHFSGMLPYTTELHSIFAKSLLLSE